MRVFLLFSQNNKPDRERLAGFLRYNAMLPVKWDVRMLDASSTAPYDKCRKLCMDWNPDAFVFSEYAMFRNLLRGIPCLRRTKYRIGIDVQLDSHRLKIHQVTLDNHQLIMSALDLLAKRGYHNLAFVGTEAPDERLYSRDVEDTFRAIVQDSGNAPFSFRFASNKSLTSTLSEASAWLSSLPKPCGVLAYSDEVAQQIIVACKLSGISIPQQVSVIGVDNHEDICETSQPTLTSILPDFEQSGHLAAMLLSRLSASRKPAGHATEKLSYGIKGIYERATTQDSRNSGRLTSAIQDIIRSEGAGPLTVSSIARRLGASIRLIELHFKSVTGHTIRDELMRFRCTQLRERILTEHRTFTELSLGCGFRTINAAQIAFRKTFGHSMRECRARFAETLLCQQGQTLLTQ